MCGHSPSFLSAAIWGRRALRAPSARLRLAQRSERHAELCRKELGLLPGCELAALVELVVVDEPGIRLLRPIARRLDMTSPGKTLTATGMETPLVSKKATLYS